MKVKFIGVNQVIKIHDRIINRYGGSHGIRDTNLLESAVAQPKMFVFGSYVHSDIFHMAAAYAFHIIKNHPFVDGNKRTGILSATLFLEKNDYILETNFDSLYTLAIKIACSELTKEEIAHFFSKNTK